MCIPLGFLYHYNGIKYIVQKTKVLFIISLFIYHLITKLPRQACGGVTEPQEDRTYRDNKFRIY